MNAARSLHILPLRPLLVVAALFLAPLGAACGTDCERDLLVIHKGLQPAADVAPIIRSLGLSVPLAHPRGDGTAPLELPELLFEYKLRGEPVPSSFQRRLLDHATGLLDTSETNLDPRGRGRQRIVYALSQHPGVALKLPLLQNNRTLEQLAYQQLSTQLREQGMGQRLAAQGLIVRVPTVMINEGDLPPSLSRIFAAKNLTLDGLRRDYGMVFQPLVDGITFDVALHEHLEELGIKPFRGMTFAQLRLPPRVVALFAELREWNKPFSAALRAHRIPHSPQIIADANSYDLIAALDYVYGYGETVYFEGEEFKRYDGVAIDLNPGLRNLVVEVVPGGALEGDIHLIDF